MVSIVFAQLGMALFLQKSSWLKILFVSYVFGAFCNHSLFLAIHELSHNLVFDSPFFNKILGIFCNLPIGVPMSITFQKYHMEHHRFQGVEGIDVDVPSKFEGNYIKNTFSKLVWVIFQLFFYALRPLFINPKPPGTWEFLNLAVQLSFDCVLVNFFGWKSFLYLILSTFVGGGLHPIAGHFIAEHYVFKEGQETYSYYGPLNFLTWNVGYHNEHHDFPRISGSLLHKVKEIAPEYYKDLASHHSWTHVIYKYITDPSIGPYSRVKRPRKAKSN